MWKYWTEYLRKTRGKSYFSVFSQNRHKEFFYFLAMPCGLWDPISQTRAQTRGHVSETAESWPLDLQGVPRKEFFFNWDAVDTFVVVQLLSHVWFFVTPWTAARQAPLPPLSPRVCSNSCPFSWWGHPTISSSASPFSFCLQSFPAWGPFQCTDSLL